MQILEADNHDFEAGSGPRQDVGHEVRTVTRSVVHPDSRPSTPSDR
ncbi:hypothetical protein [Streptomyces sp. NPDC021356]